MSRKKVPDDWETETSSDTDDYDDGKRKTTDFSPLFSFHIVCSSRYYADEELSDTDDDALDEMMRNVDVGGGRDFTVYQQNGGAGARGPTTINGRTPTVQPPKHLKGRALGEWWRDYGKAKKLATNGGLDKKELRKLKKEKREARNDPKLVSAVNV